MATGIYSVLLDSNIHLSRTLRDWIYLLSFMSGESIYEVFHTRDIQAEVDYHARRAAPDADDAQLASRWRNSQELATSKMIQDFPVDPDREEYADFPDQHDLHVTEAARHLPVDALVTNDKRLLAWAARADDLLEFDVMDADTFLMQVVDFTSSEFRISVLRKQLAYWSNEQGQSQSGDLTDHLILAAAPRFAEEVRSLLRIMARR